MTRFLITLTALFASATITAALALFSGWPVAILAGAVAFLATQHMAGSFARRKDKRAAQREIAALRRMTLELDQSLNATRHRMDDLSKEFEATQPAAGQEDRFRTQGAGKPDARIRRPCFQSRARAVQDTIEPAQIMQTGKPPGLGQAPISPAWASSESAGNHPRQPGREPRRSLSAADRQPAAKKAALLRSSVAAARRRRLGDHAGAIYESGAPRRPDECGGQSAAVPLRPGGAPLDAQEPRRGRVLQHLRRHAGRPRNSSRNSWTICTPTRIWPGISCSNSTRMR